MRTLRCFVMPMKCLRRVSITGACFLSVLLTANSVHAQTPPGGGTPAVVSADNTPKAEPSAKDDRYHIGPGDVIEVRVFERPQLSLDAIRVDGRGMIRLPLIEEEIQATCRTEGDLAKEIARLYLKYQTDPQVSVFVKEYNSQPVAIIGAVNSPGRFQLQRRIRLLELLTFAGGPNERSGRSIQVVHTDTSMPCGPSAAGPAAASDTGFESYALTDTLKGVEESNPYVRPGDIISVPDADQVFVVGNVIRPMSIPLKGPLSVTQAIAAAGGVEQDTKRDKIRIIRQLQGSSAKTEVFIDLKAIEARRAEDVALQAGDIIDVPVSGGKRFWRTLVSAVAPAVANTPVRVIR